jgi:iron complex outermembrane receptor protein
MYQRQPTMRAKCAGGKLHSGLACLALAGSSSILVVAFMSGVADAQSTTADPQTAPAASIEEVVVTAQRREEKLRDVPIAVTALNSAAIEARNIANIDDIAGFAPNVVMVQSPSYGNQTTISIRGGVTIDPSLYWETAVGIYVDGIYFSKSQANAFDLEDIDHIEVLRGPQGTLYGRNTLDGAVNFVTQKPTGIFGGNIQATFGDYGYKKGRINLNLPEFGRLKIKISGLIESRDGFVKFASDPFHLPSFLVSPPTVSEFDNLDNKAARLAARLDVTDDLTLDYTADAYYRTDIPEASQLTAIGLGGPASIFDPNSPSYSGLPLYLYLQHNPQALKNYSNASVNGSAIFGNSGTRSQSLTATWYVDDALTLKSISAYRWTDWSTGNDLDGSPMDIATTQNFTRYHSFSQELQAAGQIDRFHYTTGAYYFNDGGHSVQPQDFFLGASLFNSQYDTSTSAYALYGQVEYNPPILDDKLTFTFGLRYSNESKRGARSLYAASTGTPFVPVIPFVAASKSFDAATPLFVVKYNLDENVNVYAKYAEGFRSGGFNGQATVLSEAITPFNAETVDEYEVGAKTKWLDGRLNANLALFYDDHQNMQLSIFTGNASVGSIVRNAGAAVIDGVELELDGLPLPWLRLSGSTGYLNTSYSQFIVNGVNQANDHAFPAAPQFTAHVSADATLMEDGFGKLDFIVDYNHSDAYYYYPYSLSANPAINLGYYAGTTKASALNTIDARLRLTDVQAQYGTLDIALWGKNIFDDRARINGIDFGPSFGNLTVSYYNRPATFGADLTFHFGS